MAIRAGSGAAGVAGDGAGRPEARALRELLEHLCGSTGADRAYVLRLLGAQVEVAGAWSRPGAPDLAAGASIARADLHGFVEALRAGARPTALLLDAQGPWAARALVGAVPAGFAAVGVHHADALWGAVCVDTVDRPAPWQEPPVTLDLGADGVRALVAAAESEAARRNAEEARQAFVAFNPDVLLRLDVEGHILDAHAGEPAELPRAAEDLVGQNVSDVFPELAADVLLAGVEMALSGNEAVAVEYRLPGERGPQVFRFRLAPAAPGEVVGVGRNVTERVRIEENLRASEERFRSLVANSSDLMLVVDDHRIVYASEAVEWLLAQDPESLVGSDLFDLVHPDDTETAASLVRRAGPGAARNQRKLVRLRHLDGSWRWFEAVAANDLTEGPLRGVVVNARDVTDRVAAEDAAREAQRSIEAIFDASPDILASFDREYRMLRVSAATTAVTGQPPEFFHGRSHRELGFPPEFYEPVEQAIDEVLATGRVRTFVVPFVDPRGRTMWNEIRFAPERDAEGRPVRVVAVGHDITRRLNALAAAEASEARLQALLRSSADVVAIVRPEDGRIEYVSPNCERVWGYPPEVVVDRVLEDWPVLDEDRAGLAEALARAAATPGEPVVRAARLFHADGGTRDLLATFLSPGDDSPVGGVVLNVMDVTERADEHRRFEALVELMPRRLVTVRADGTVTYRSDAFADTVAALEPGDRLFDRVHPDDVAVVAKLVADIAGGSRRTGRTQALAQHPSSGIWEALVLDALALPLTAGGEREVALVVRWASDDDAPPAFGTPPEAG